MQPGSERTTVAQMAESVDALVSNTNGCKAVPVRPRLWVREGETTIVVSPFFMPDRLAPSVIQLYTIT